MPNIESSLRSPRAARGHAYEADMRGVVEHDPRQGRRASRGQFAARGPPGVIVAQAKPFHQRELAQMAPAGRVRGAPSHTRCMRQMKVPTKRSVQIAFLLGRTTPDALR